MQITLTWHLVIVLLIQIAIIIWFINSLKDWIPIFPFLCILLSLLLWSLYGGIFIW